MKLIFGFFGFYRDGHNYSYNFDIKSSIYKKYIYTPTILNEDTDNKNNIDDLKKKFGNDTKIQIYEYDKHTNINHCKLFTDQKFINCWYQQGYRIFSFFNNIRGVLKIIKDDNYYADDIIILSRIDIGLSIKNKDELLKLLLNNDVIVTSTDGKSVDDKVFIFKYKYINIFIKLYDDYGIYIKKIKNNEKDRPASTRPEDIFFYHLKKNNLKIISTNLIIYHFRHVCSKYCGHNRQSTQT
tara:strand:- start:15623 stop:16342 length:720 start_codon:yes stop_codon:yes gene_type:complete